MWNPSLLSRWTVLLAMIRTGRLQAPTGPRSQALPSPCPIYHLHDLSSLPRLQATVVPLLSSNSGFRVHRVYSVKTLRSSTYLGRISPPLQMRGLIKQSMQDPSLHWMRPEPSIPGMGSCMLCGPSSSALRLVISNPTSLNPTFSAPAVLVDGADLVFRLTVTGKSGLLSQDTCKIHINHAE